MTGGHRASPGCISGAVANALDYLQELREERQPYGSLVPIRFISARLEPLKARFNRWK